MKLTIDQIKLARQSMDDLLAKTNEHRPNSKWRLGSCTYSDSEAVFKLKLQVVAEDGTLLDEDYQRLQNCLGDIGLEKKHLESIIQCSFGKAKIVGLRRSGQKLILQAVDTGKRYLAPLSAVQGKGGGKMTWEERVTQLEAEGMTRSDAQGVVDVEILDGWRPTDFQPWMDIRANSRLPSSGGWWAGQKV